MFKKFATTAFVTASLAACSSVAMAKSIYSKEAYSNPECKKLVLEVSKGKPTEFSMLDTTREQQERAFSVMNKSGCELVRYGLGQTMFILSIMGSGDRSGIETAKRLFQPLAEQGYKEAQFYMGSIYGSGFAGMTVDMNAAKKWLKKSAAQGYRPAKEALGQ